MSTAGRGVHASITVEEHPRADDERVVLDGLHRFNVAVIGEPDLRPLAVFARDASGKVVGGLLGHTKWRWLYIAKFWLPAELRGRGLGTQLIRAAEEEARSRECEGVALDTLEYQALPFYQKNGYELFGVLDGFPPGYKQYFLKKVLGGR
ncbi:MAG TPA: GNAT family N-acetyltransferase [Gemmatimonadaceae bacterium]